MDMNALAEIDLDNIPAAILVDEYHPLGDEYTKNLQAIQRLIVAASAKLRPNQINAVKQHHSGSSNTLISDRLGVNPATVATWLKKPAAQELKNLLGFYAASVGGVRVDQRRHMLWCIAVDNQHQAPKTTVTAIAEINRMDMNVHTVNTAAPTGDTTVNVIINQDQLPKTALDG